jgi:hypothetical protein
MKTAEQDGKLKVLDNLMNISSSDGTNISMKVLYSFSKLKIDKFFNIYDIKRINFGKLDLEKNNFLHHLFSNRHLT